MLVVDSDRGSIGFDGELVADITRRHAVAIAIEREPNIFMDQRFDGFTVIGNHGRQRPERLRLKAFIGSLAGFAVLTPVGNLFEPLTGLRVYIGQTG